MRGDSALILKKGYGRWRMSQSPSKGERWVFHLCEVRRGGRGLVPQGQHPQPSGAV